MKKILVTGAGSYIGESFQSYMKLWQNEYTVDCVDTIGDEWLEKSFSEYYAVYHVAGIAHVKETKENANLYYKVNRNLAVDVAKKAKADGVKQFIFMSSMSVYGLNTGVITRNTEPKPVSNYGKSKLEAEHLLGELSDDSFIVTILRPPMVYGKDCRGNFQTVINLVKRLPVFPKVQNQRSMIYIENLCSFVKFCLDQHLSGLYFPQNKGFVQTTEMAEIIANATNKKIHMSHLLGWGVKLGMPFMATLQKAFGSLIYLDMDEFKFAYCVVDNEESIRQSV